jgi:hypothetical protein
MKKTKKNKRGATKRGGTNAYNERTELVPFKTPDGEIRLIQKSAEAGYAQGKIKPYNFLMDLVPYTGKYNEKKKEGELLLVTENTTTNIKKPAPPIIKKKLAPPIIKKKPAPPIIKKPIKPVPSVLAPAQPIKFMIPPAPAPPVSYNLASSSNPAAYPSYDMASSSNPAVPYDMGAANEGPSYDLGAANEKGKYAVANPGIVSYDLGAANEGAYDVAKPGTVSYVLGAANEEGLYSTVEEAKANLAQANLAQAKAKGAKGGNMKKKRLTQRKKKHTTKKKNTYTFGKSIKKHLKKKYF